MLCPRKLNRVSANSTDQWKKENHQKGGSRFPFINPFVAVIIIERRIKMQIRILGIGCPKATKRSKSETTNKH